MIGLTAVLLALSLSSSLVSCQFILPSIQDGPLEENNSCRTPLGQNGICKNIRQCTELLNLLISRRPGSADLLRRSTCCYKNRDPIVCCPGSTVNANDTTQPSNNTLNRFQNLPSLDVCGKTDVFHIRVVGGQPANLGGWPWVAALGYRSRRNPGPEWLCGGTLVTDRHVITAGHCVVGTGDKKLFLVRLGDLDINDAVNDGASPLDVRVDKVTPHPNYRSNQNVNDIAIVRMERSVRFSYLIRPICLPTQSDFQDEDLVGFSPYVAGWGATEFRGPSSTHLQEVQIEITDLPGCKHAFRNRAKAVIDKRVICAGESGKDACQGDSGGPLMLPQGKDNYFLIGVVSYGYKCAEPGYPGVYTNVYEFMDWIVPNLS